MKQVVYSARAFKDLERVTDHLVEFEATDVAQRIQTIVSAVEVLATSPFIGRPIRGALRELVISQGRTGYVVMYRVVAHRVEVLALRHQREAGYR